MKSCLLRIFGLKSCEKVKPSDETYRSQNTGAEEQCALNTSNNNTNSYRLSLSRASKLACFQTTTSSHLLLCIAIHSFTPALSYALTILLSLLALARSRISLSAGLLRSLTSSRIANARGRWPEVMTVTISAIRHHVKPSSSTCSPGPYSSIWDARPQDSLGTAASP